MRALADEYLTEHDGEDEAEGSAEKNAGKIVRANHNAAYRNQRRVAYRANPKKSFRQFFVPERDVRILSFTNAKLKFNKNIANIKKVRIFAVLKTTWCP